MRTSKLSPHFTLAELLPTNVPEDDVPLDVHTNLEMLATEILEPMRVALALPLHIHSGYRPPTHNAAVGGKPSSDHMTGNAADFHVDGTPESTWQQSTIHAYHWLMTEMAGRFGQIILEDHRKHYGNPAKLWIHVSNTTPRHPGTEGDVNRLLLSWSPTEYEKYTLNRAPVA